MIKADDIFMVGQKIAFHWLLSKGLPPLGFTHLALQFGRQDMTSPPSYDIFALQPNCAKVELPDLLYHCYLT